MTLPMVPQPALVEEGAQRPSRNHRWGTNGSSEAGMTLPMVPQTALVEEGAQRPSRNRGQVVP